MNWAESPHAITGSSPALGVNPGLVKWEGTQSVLWGEGVREQFQAPELNLARYIKDGTVTDQDNGE